MVIFLVNVPPQIFWPYIVAYKGYHILGTEFNLFQTHVFLKYDLGVAPTDIPFTHRSNHACLPYTNLATKGCAYWILWSHFALYLVTKNRIDRVKERIEKWHWIPLIAEWVMFVGCNTNKYVLSIKNEDDRSLYIMSWDHVCYIVM